MIAAIPKTSRVNVSTRTFVIRLAAGGLLINLFVTGLAGFSLYRSRQLYESRVAIQTQNLSQSLSLTIAGIIDKTGLTLFSVKREIERNIKNGSIDSLALNEYAIEQRKRIHEIDGLRIANARGELKYGDRVVIGSNTNVTDREYFIYARNNPAAGLIISKPLLARSSQQWEINIVRRINNPDGSFAGIVIAAISLDYVSKLFSSFDLGKRGVITLRDGELAIIVRYPEPPGGISSMGSKVVSNELRALTQAGHAADTYKTKSRLDAIERTFSYSKIPDTNLYVNVGFANSDYLEPWHHEVKDMMLLAALFATGSLLSAGVIYRKRMHEKRAAAELIQHREHLEETVRERTFELEARNIQLAEEIVLRKQYEADLKKAAIIMDKMPDAVDWFSKDGKYLYVNDAACKMHGYTREELLSMSVSDVAPDFPPDAWQLHWDELKQEGCLHFETVNKTREGQAFPVEVTANYLSIDGIEYNCAIVRNISDRKEAEAEKQNLMVQLGQSQKIESIGRLAGGIAHDFNNLLTPILGYAGLLKGSLPPDSRDFERVDKIMQAADKARVLTQQFLSFGRKQILEMKIIDMNNVILSFYEILRRTIRENIAIQLNLTEITYGIRADRNQLEQIIMNLAINAQDAISDRGSITIETACVSLDEEYARQHANVTPGEYLLLAVTDSGSGMDQGTLDHIFEPFFTTKEVGKGTGLGLATVYGLVKQHEGDVWVYSEIDKGTVFKIYFPIVEGMPTVEPIGVSDRTNVIAHDCTILLVEDNEMVRNLVCDLLDNCGCTVIVAEGPKQALKICEDHPIDLLLTDVVMPDMNGPELHQKLLKTHQDIKALYMSGYTNNVIVHHGVLNEGINFIQKPFAVNDLILKINSILNESATS